MKNTVNFSQFCDGFSGNYANGFSYAGKQALFDYLRKLEEDTGEDIEFDPIAICGDYTEYKNLEECQKDYNDIETIEELEDNTNFIPVGDGFIIQDY